MQEADMEVINCNSEDNVGLSEMSERCVTLFSRLMCLNWEDLLVARLNCCTA